MIIKTRRPQGGLEATAMAIYDTDVHHHDKVRFISSKKSLKMVSGALYLLKDNKLKPQGEDAHFICEQSIGVTDGVGAGWARKGVDVGEYARQLMTNSVIAIRNEPKGDVDPKRVLHEAYSNTKAQGLSIACILTLRGHWLHVVNIGDSGFLLIRDGKVVYQSPIQQHRFNCPYQLGTSEKSDRPSAVMELKVSVKAGDIVVAGTDGLLDNVFPIKIEVMEKCEEPQQLALTIAQLAFYNSLDEYADTPFSRAAMCAGHEHLGGQI